MGAAAGRLAKWLAASSGAIRDASKGAPSRSREQWSEHGRRGGRDGETGGGETGQRRNRQRRNQQRRNRQRRNRQRRRQQRQRRR